jgi:hypothetical protein
MAGPVGQNEIARPTGAAKMMAVLKEYHQVKQEPGGGHRRWFVDGTLELVVWYGGDKGIEGFQVCYPGKDGVERALTWRPGTGFSHAQVDAGDARPDKNLTPVLVPDGAVPWREVHDLFETRGAELEPAVRDLVLGALGGKT